MPGETLDLTLGGTGGTAPAGPEHGGIEWGTGSAHIDGDVVSYGGVVYFANGDPLPGTPPPGAPWVAVEGLGGPETFIDLTDTDPVGYAGETGKLVAVNVAEDGLEFIDAPAGTELFSELLDTPPDFTGAAGFRVTVNATEDGLVFNESSGLGVMAARYRFNSATAIADPGLGRVSINNADSTLATRALVSTEDFNGVNRDYGLGILGEFDILGFNDQNTSDHYTYQVDGDGIDHGTYWEYPVVHIRTIGGLNNNEDLELEVVLVGTKTFHGLLDTPADYVGNAGNLVLVNQAEDGLEFAAGLLSASMNWRNVWVPVEYHKNDVVTQDGYAMVANQTTFDNAAPQIVGSPERDVDNLVLIDTAGPSEVVSQVHNYTMTKEGWLKELYIKAPDFDIDTIARVVVKNNATSEQTVMDNVILSAGKWVLLAGFNDWVNVGDSFTIIFNLYNSSASSDVTGGWTARVGLGNPLVGEVVMNDTLNPTTITYSNTDLDSTDRATELAGIGNGGVINISETGDNSRYVEADVLAIDTSNPDWTIYTVATLDSNKGVRDGQTTTSVLHSPIVVPTHYYLGAGTRPGNDPSWATITSELWFGTVDQGVADASFGIDMTFQQGEQSTHWDVLSTPGGGSSGTGTDANIEWGEIYGLITDQEDLQVALNGKGDMNKSLYDSDLSGVVDNAQLVNGKEVFEDVPLGAVFTDTVYDDTGLQNQINNKANSSQVLTDVPAGALFTDTVYDDTALDARVTVNEGIVSDLELNKEDDLGLPAGNNYVLASDTLGNRAWFDASAIGVTSVNGAQGAVVVDTSNVAENGPLYFTNVRADARVQDAIDDAVSTGTTLYSSAKIDSLVAGALNYKGAWNAATNAPSLSDGTGVQNDYYKVSVAGSQDLGSGSITFAEGDDVIHNGTIWEKFGSVVAIDSVNGQVGTVVLDTDDIAEGVTNLYHTNARVDARLTGLIDDNTTVGTSVWSSFKTDAAINSAVGAITHPIISVNGYTGTVVLAKGDVGLGNVDNTTDMAKPVSTATGNAIAPKIEVDDYAQPTVGGTVKARLAGGVLYLSTDGTNP